MLYGRTNAAIASRFLREIPEDLIEKKGGFNAAPRYNAIDTQQSRAWNDYSAYKPKPPQPSYSVSSTQKTTYLELNKGDMVHHAGFGKGMVLSVMKMGGDALLEIAFDQIGTKKLMAKTASQHMKKL
jgi:DNA helicase-2/ATP-dependent DNA helicase PcrA